MGRREEVIRLAFGGPKDEETPEPELTEDRVREIVREELAKPKSDAS